MRLDRDRSSVGKEQGRSVRSRILDGTRTNASAGARSILDDHGPAEALLHVIGKHPRYSVRGAAGAEREHDLQRLLLRAGRSRPQSGQREADQNDPT